MQSREHKEFNKTVAKILDVIEISQAPVKLKGLVKDEIWDLFRRLNLKEQIEESEIDGNKEQN